MSRDTVLIVDDEAAIRFGVREYLDRQGYRVVEAETWQGAEEVFQRDPPDAAILDYVLPDGNALDALPQLRGYHPYTALIVLTAHGSIELAVEAMKQGADHFLTKPLELSALSTILDRLLEDRRTRRRDQAGRVTQSRNAVDPFMGSSAAIQAFGAPGEENCRFHESHTGARGNRYG